MPERRTPEPSRPNFRAGAAYPSPSMHHAFQEFSAGILDLLFPPRCLLCDRMGEPFCEDCRAQIRPEPAGAVVPPGIEDARSAGLHEGPLRQAVLRLKFGRKVALVRPLGELLAAQLLTLRGEWQPDFVAPVPVHWTRLLERGFNQSELLAETLARCLQIPMLPALRKVRQTPPQVGLAGEPRRTNLRGAFAVRLPVSGRRIVLVDDVRTTGATVSECARTLRAAGAAEVYAATVTHDL